MATAQQRSYDSDSSDDDSSDEFEEEQEKKNSCCKKILRFFFSFVGIFILLGLYTTGGAYYFYNLERPLEQNRHDIMMARAADVEASMAYVAAHLTYIQYDRHGKYDNCSVFVEDKFFAPSHTYSDVCVDLADPETQRSRFCKCVWLYKRRFEEAARGDVERLVQFTVLLAEEFDYKLDEETRQPKWEWQWTFPNALLFTMTTLTLIGYGRIAPSTESGKLICICYAIVGLPLMMLFLANIGGTMAKFITWIYSRLCCRWCRVRRKHSELPDYASDNPGELEKLTLKHDHTPKEVYMPTADILVPIILTICLMGGYVMIGAVIYVEWENWDLMDSAYFTFITLTTIGFGDLVPGASFVDQESDTSLIIKLLFTTFYCLMGLALISMGISLMQEQVSRKAQWVSQQQQGDGKYPGMRKYIITKFEDVRETPPDRTGNQLSYRAKHRDEDDFDEVVQVEDVETLSEEEHEEGGEEEGGEEKEEGGEDEKGEEEEQKKEGEGEANSEEPTGGEENAA